MLVYSITFEQLRYGLRYLSNYMHKKRAYPPLILSSIAILFQMGPVVVGIRDIGRRMGQWDRLTNMKIEY